MANFTLSVLDEVLKDVVLPEIEKLLMDETGILSLFGARPGKYTGRKQIMALKTDRNQGIGARAEGGTLPTAQTADYLQFEVMAKYVYGRFAVTGVAKAIGQGLGSLVNAMQEAMTDMVESFRVNLNRILWGDGTGKLAQVNGDVSSDTTVTVDGVTGYGQNAVGTRFLAKGMIIDTAGGASNNLDSESIASVDSTTQITMSQNVTVDDNAWIYLEDSKDKEPMGLLGIVDDGTIVSTFQNLSRSTYEQVQALVLGNSGTGRDLTESLLAQAVMQPYERAGARIDLLLMHPSMWRTYAESLISADRSFLVRPNETPVYSGGYNPAQASYMGVPIKLDLDCPIHRVFALDTSVITYYYAGDGIVSWMDDDGRILSRVADKDAVEGVIRTYGNLVCRNPMKQCRIDDLNYTAPGFIEHR